jgi:hypothetical protein
MQIVRIILFGLIGFFLAYGIVYVTEFGYLERWRKITSPSENIYGYFLATDNTQNHQGGLIITNPCDYSKPEFSFISNFPKNISKCVQVTTLYPEGESRNTYVYDRNGTVWEWSYLVYVDLGAMICWPFIGLLIGVLIAIITRKPKQTKAFSAA